MARAMESGELGDLGAAVRELTGEARELAARVAESLQLERRMEERPLAVLGMAAAAGFVLGGGLWPALRPLVRAAARTALSPANVLALGAALGALRAAGGRPAAEEPSSAPH